MDSQSFFQLDFDLFKVLSLAEQTNIIYEEQVAYTWSEFLADVGGSAGLILGLRYKLFIFNFLVKFFSVLTMVQYIARTCSAFSARILNYTGEKRYQWRQSRCETVTTVDKSIGVTQHNIKSESFLQTHM